MNKSFALLAGAGMLLTAVPALHAQDAATAPATGAASGPFEDVPADHWAYGAVKTLQDAHIVIGYPDGTYGGRRPMTRYEFATAIARLLPLLQGNNNYATKDDLAALRSDLESKLAANQAALDALKALVDEFRPELQKLGQDVDAIDKRLDNIEGRLALVEAEQQRVKITGDVNFIAESATSAHRDAAKDYLPYIDKNGVTQPNPNLDNRFFSNSAVYHDILLHIRGKVSDTATANVDLDWGNYLSAVGNTARAGIGPVAQSVKDGADGINNVSVYQAYLASPLRLGPLGGVEAKIGRFGTQQTKWTLQQPDSDIYTNLIQTDSGNQIIDGGQINLKLGPFATQAFAGKFGQWNYSTPAVGTNNVGLTNQVGAHPVGQTEGANAITQGAGARFVLGAPEGATFGATIAQYALGTTVNGLSADPTDPNRTGTQYNRVSVYGLDGQGALPFGKKIGLTAEGAITVSAHGANAGFNNVGNGYRYSSNEEKLGFAIGKLSFKGGYEFVGPEFSAPGYWGKIGAWTNPTNIEGPTYALKYALSQKLALNADYEQYKAAYSGDQTSPLRKGDHINRYQVGASYGLSSAYAVDLGYEEVQYDLRNNEGTLLNAGKPKESYLTFGVGHPLSSNLSFKLLYQIGVYNDHNTGYQTPVGGDSNYAGNTAVGQFQLKF